MALEKIKETFVNKYWPDRPFRLIYFGYLLSCIGDKLWWFAMIILFVDLGGMRLVSANQLFEALSIVLLSTSIGKWLDNSDRRRGVHILLAVNNLSIALAAVLLLTSLSLNSSTSLGSLAYYVCIILAMIICAISRCAAEGQTMTLTKDWVVLMAKKDEIDTLSRRNASMTAIMQFSSVVAPFISGQVLVLLGHRMACISLAAWNLLSWAVERRIYSQVYAEVDTLREKSPYIPDISIIANQQQCEFLPNAYNSEPASTSALPTRDHVLKWLRQMLKALKSYYNQSVFPAAISLALLFLTVLGLGGIAISYGKSQNIPDNLLGFLQSAGSLLSLCGAFSYTLLEQRIGVNKTGIVGLAIQQFFLSWCLISVWLPGSPMDLRGYFSTESPGIETSLNNTTANEALPLPNSIIYAIHKNITHPASEKLTEKPMLSIMVFFCGMVLSRIGLWIADLSIIQIMQQAVAEEERNTIFGVQNAANQLFSILKDVAAIALPDPRTFGLLIVASVICVGMGSVSYCYYLVRLRKKPKGNRNA
ncbi:ferroportin1 (FPN1) domain-containing protein [Ditylenchus destructor]|uniref:Solute carrier family 40 member n=1 Tax=Ditylenchus destructor TaxID=166010 RepID=A0AAD4QY37_9BILA|nr:ferroportin1 (FPN1) domain-containing protein [Ditylenchus destructor]